MLYASYDPAQLGSYHPTRNLTSPVSGLPHPAPPPFVPKLLRAHGGKKESITWHVNIVQQGRGCRRATREGEVKFLVGLRECVGLLAARKTPPKGMKGAQQGQVHMRMHVCMCVSMCICMCMYTCMGMGVCMCMWMCVRKCVCVCACMRVELHFSHCPITIGRQGL